MSQKPEERFPAAGPFSDALWQLGESLGRLQAPHQHHQQQPPQSMPPQSPAPSPTPPPSTPTPEPTPEPPHSKAPQPRPAPTPPAFGDPGSQTIAEFPQNQSSGDMFSDLRPKTFNQNHPPREKTVPATSPPPPPRREAPGNGETLFGMLQHEDVANPKTQVNLDREDAFEAALENDENNDYGTNTTEFGRDKAKTKKWIFVAIAACHSLHAIICFFLFRRGRWKKVQV